MDAGDEVRLAARSVVLDEDEVVVEELAAEDDVVVLLLLLCDFEVELAAALELAEVADANAAGKSCPSGHPVPPPWQGFVKQHP